MTPIAKFVPLLILVAAILWFWKPWDSQTTAQRPDTGETVAQLENDALHPVLTELLTRVYSAFGEEEEFAIYDGLATAVASDLLTDLYLQRRTAQEQEYTEGGKVTIQSLDISELTPLPGSGPDQQIDTSWTVRGIVSHGEHQHERVNAYAAQLTLGPADGEWRLTGFDLDQIRREEPEALFLDDFE